QGYFDFSFAGSGVRLFRGRSYRTDFHGPSAQTTLSLVMPGETAAEAVLEATSDLSNRPRREYRYGRQEVFPAVYLAPLLRRAEAGAVDAARAIGRMESAEATEALIYLVRHS